MVCWLTPTGGELVKLPQQPSTMNGIRRNGKLTLTISGDLQGDVQEVRVGDRAAGGAGGLYVGAAASDKIKPIESLLADSLSIFHISNASVSNPDLNRQPFHLELLLSGPRIMRNLRATCCWCAPVCWEANPAGCWRHRSPAVIPSNLRGPCRISTPLKSPCRPVTWWMTCPPPSMRTLALRAIIPKRKSWGMCCRYRRTFEVKELSVPASDAAQLRKFYRIIASDERNTAVLKLGSH